MYVYPLDYTNILCRATKINLIKHGVCTYWWQRTCMSKCTSSKRKGHSMVFITLTKLSVFSRCLFTSQKSLIIVKTWSGARIFLKPRSV